MSHLPSKGFIDLVGSVSFNMNPETATWSKESADATAKGARWEPVLFMMNEANIGMAITAFNMYMYCRRNAGSAATIGITNVGQRHTQQAATI